MAKKTTNPDVRSDKRAANAEANRKDRNAAKEAQQPITGVPTEAQKAKARSKARGPKQGSAMASQSVKLSQEDAAQVTAEAKTRTSSDRIANIAIARTGEHVVLENATKDAKASVAVNKTRLTGQLAKLAVVGGSLKAVRDYIKEHKPEAKLAVGVTGRDAPHASKAIADAKGGRSAPRAEVKPPFKEEKAERKPTSKGAEDDRKLIYVAPNPKKAGTSTYERYDAAYKVGRTVAEALKHTTRADIAWDLKRGFIKLG